MEVYSLSILQIKGIIFYDPIFDEIGNRRTSDMKRSHFRIHLSYKRIY